MLNPHRRVAVVRSLWDIPALYRLPRRIIVVRRTRCKRRRAADCEYEGYQQKFCSFHIKSFFLKLHSLYSPMFLNPNIR